MDEHVHRHHEENMLSVEDARDKILGTVRKTEKVTIPVIDSLGLVLSDNVESSINIPPTAPEMVLWEKILVLFDPFGAF